MSGVEIWSHKVMFVCEIRFGMHVNYEYFPSFTLLKVSQKPFYLHWQRTRQSPQPNYSDWKAFHFKLLGPKKGSFPIHSVYLCICQYAFFIKTCGLQPSGLLKTSVACIAFFCILRFNLYTGITAQSQDMNEPIIGRTIGPSIYKSSVACIEDLWTLDRTCSASNWIFRKQK